MMTHQAPCSVVACFCTVACFCFPDGRSDTTSENNDHLFGRGLVGKCKKAIDSSTRLAKQESHMMISIKQKREAWKENQSKTNLAFFLAKVQTQTRASSCSITPAALKKKCSHSKVAAFLMFTLKKKIVWYFYFCGLQTPPASAVAKATAEIQNSNITP